MGISSLMTRRDFVKTAGCTAGALFIGGRCGRQESGSGAAVETVTGPVSATDMGLTLPHEHIMCDFIGADKITKDRYRPEEVIETMLPFVDEIKKLGVRTFIDCTPAYLARDPLVLRALSEKTGVRFLTNTGFYKEPYLPRFTWDISGDELAGRWEREIRDGIDDTGVRAGFVKIAVNPGPLIPVQRKIVIAAARVEKRTGVAVASHTGKGIPALEQLDIFEKEGADPGKFIFVHAQGEEDMAYHYEVARRGAWVEYDAISEETAGKDYERIRLMMEKDFAGKILLSQDRGWFNVGQENGGNIRGYTYLIEGFLPLLRAKGFDDDIINLLTVVNPARAFGVERRDV